MPLTAEQDLHRRRELKRCRSDLWYLATEYLGYGWNPRAGKGVFRGKGLTERLHKPVCKWLDRYRSDFFMGMWISRWHHKTTLVIASIVQDFLRDPDIALFYFHSVEDEAWKVVAEVSNHVKSNEKLRSLDPIGVLPDGKPYRAFPQKRAVRNYKSDRVTLYRPPEMFSRFPSLLGAGSGSEITGAHANKAYLDDVITGRTVRENQLPRIQSWVQNTVIPVVDDMVLRVTGTPWSDWGLYTQWQEDPDWRTIVFPGSVNERLEEIDWKAKKIHLTPDETLENPIYGLLEDQARMTKRLKILRRQMKQDFAPQIMCDPSPAGEKPWDMERCEHTIGWKEALRLKGTTVVISDPAPLNVGSLDGRAERERKDGTKDEWATAVVRLCVKGDRLFRVLLDGRASRRWTKDRGFDEMCKLAKYWKAEYMTYEATGQAIALYDEDLEKAARRCGVIYRRPRWRDKKGTEKQGLSWTYMGKNHYFAALASSAELGDVYYAAYADHPRSAEFREFMEGSGSDLGALQQARGWRPMESGRTGLRYDDRANVWAMSMDPSLEQSAPLPGEFDEDIDDWESGEETDMTWSRYCAI